MIDIGGMVQRFSEVMPETAACSIGLHPGCNAALAVTFVCIMPCGCVARGAIEFPVPPVCETEDQADQVRLQFAAGCELQYEKMLLELLRGHQIAKVDGKPLH